MHTDTHADRPETACLLCPRPNLRPADAGYRTCTPCLDRLRALLREVVARYLRLDPAPGERGDRGRRIPGFGSRSPASDHIIAMCDPRSKSHEVAVDVIEYVWDSRAGAFVGKREGWIGADGRVYCEDPRPVRSIPGTLSSWVRLIAELRGIEGRLPVIVPDMVSWLDRQLDWVSREPLIADLHHDIRELIAQLRPVTGDRRHRVGACPNTIDDGDTSRECGAPLFAPLRGDTIRCSACGRAWPRPEWESLGRLLQAGVA